MNAAPSPRTLSQAKPGWVDMEQPAGEKYPPNLFISSDWVYLTNLINSVIIESSPFISLQFNLE